MTTLYLSGPMTGIEDNNFPAFNLVTRRLKYFGYLVLNPAEKGIIHGWKWADYLKYDLAELVKADGVATLPGAEMSRGARLEAHVAFELGMTIQPWRDWIELKKRDRLNVVNLDAYRMKD